MINAGNIYTNKNGLFAVFSGLKITTRLKSDHTK